MDISTLQHQRVTTPEDAEFAAETARLAALAAQRASRLARTDLRADFAAAALETPEEAAARQPVERAPIACVTTAPPLPPWAI